jgi:predicted membrane-bound spermidine synthase
MPRSGFYVLFTASGFAGLIYESIWTQYLRLFLGHAAYAQSLVLAVFMGGMALGAAWCARRSERLKNPLAAYAAAEALVGLAALVFHPVFAGLTDWSFERLLPALGGEWLALGAKLGIACLLILPQSVLLGMTFPLMSAGLARAAPRALGGSLAMLYFTNSLGGAAGVLASGFWLLDALGLPGTLRVAGVLNLAIAAAVWLVARRVRAAPLAGAPGGAEAARLLLAAAFFTGAASFFYEIGWIRMLSLVLGASTHSFELMLATFISGLALGGLAVRRRADAGEPLRLLAGVQVVMGLAALATLPVYDASFSLMEALMQGLARSETGYRLFNLSGALISALVMLPATFCAGMTLPLLTAALARGGGGERAIGEVYAANTLGAIAGVIAAVHVGLPALGLKGTLAAGAAIDMALGLVLLREAGARLGLAAALCLVALGAAAFGVELDANKMTAGVFRHGELASSRSAQVLFNRDGKTATVHLVRYSEAVSLRTNGKSDGSINMDPQGERGSDEITMVLTGAIPLALRPEARSAAVIGIGTGLTTHTLLQSLDVERVETIEIERAMAEAARGFAPRNSNAFADPRGRIVVDDAKSFFSTHGRRYDVIISEPSNPWVSGVSSLFTREFYRRVRPHLEERGLLVQWFQLYEIDPALVASVLRALGEVFPYYAIYAPSDFDLLIVASDAPLPAAPSARVFEQPALARELFTIHVLSAGDLDARYLGARALLEPLFASYGTPANSDYYPLLDLNAARSRFMDQSASELVGLVNQGVPLLELLEPSRPRRPVNPLFEGAYAFERINHTRVAWYARNFLVNAAPPAPQAVPTQLQKDLELVKLRLLECRDPARGDVWLHSALRVAQVMNPFLAAEDARAPWLRARRAPCFARLQDYQREWLELFDAVAARDPARMARLGGLLLESQVDASREAHEYLLAAALAGRLARGEREAALELWTRHGARERALGTPAFRLLRCHARAADCAQEFAHLAHDAAR